MPSWLKGFRDMKKTKQFVFSKNGSALIMTIVLTVMLAAVAVMFLAMARMDKASTSNIADNKMLDLTAMSIIEIINKELVYDTPGVAIKADIKEVNFPHYFDYKDYPDACDPWLASSEPYYTGKRDSDADEDIYKWRQISDITGYLKDKRFETQDVNVLPIGLNLPSAAKPFEVVPDYPIFGMDPNGKFLIGNTKNEAIDGISADADGDGIADSKWFELSDMRTTNGRVFAAVRIIDNGAMANVNTAYQFDPTLDDANFINGTSQTQIDLENLFESGDSLTAFHNERCGTGSSDITNFEKNIVWDFNNFPENGYLPFDISDELELRYRFCIDGLNRSRFEHLMPYTLPKDHVGDLYDGSTNQGHHDWISSIVEPNSFRHLFTTYNCDRIIDPNGNKMLNINDANITSLYNLFSKVYDSNTAAQIAVNLTDYRDVDSDVNCFTLPSGKKFYGFEAPCIYISEIAYRHRRDTIPPEDHKSYAIEIFKPYASDVNPDNKWLIFVLNGNGPMVRNWRLLSWSGSNQHHVILLKNPNDTNPLEADSASSIDVLPFDPLSPVLFQEGDTIILRRQVQNGTSTENIVVDSIKIPSNFIQEGTYSIQRDIRKHQCIRRMWSSVLGGSDPATLGAPNTGFDDENPDPNIIPAYPANTLFTNIGEIGNVFRKAAYIQIDPNGKLSTDNVIGYTPSLKLEENVRLNLTDETIYPVFNFVTALKTPYANDSDETRVKGRININTAPARVIAQLPWVSQRTDGYNDPNLAKSIVAYRDKLKEETPEPNYHYEGRSDANGFESVARLMKVRNFRPNHQNYSIDCYARDGNDIKGFPDLSTKSPTEGDEAKDDMEERDVIFARISDLVTVRSDVFTAYILVRVGTNGPQKRYIAILDRSEVKTPSDKVKIRAFQYVPDAR